jgi:hypothetical protein
MVWETIFETPHSLCSSILLSHKISRYDPTQQSFHMFVSLRAHLDPPMATDSDHKGRIQMDPDNVNMIDSTSALAPSKKRKVDDSSTLPTASTSPAATTTPTMATTTTSKEATDSKKCVDPDATVYGDENQSITFTMKRTFTLRVGERIDMKLCYDMGLIQEGMEINPLHSLTPVIKRIEKNEANDKWIDIMYTAECNDIIACRSRTGGIPVCQMYHSRLVLCP